MERYASSLSNQIGGKGTRKKLEKGYVGLLEDIIDPTPLGTNVNSAGSQLMSLLDGTAGPGWEGEMEVLSRDMLGHARLEAGMKEPGVCPYCGICGIHEITADKTFE